MGFLAKLFAKKVADGAGTGASKAIDSATNFATGLRNAITGEENQLKLAGIIAELSKARMEISLAEAQSPRFFIAGARPALLWVIVLSMALKFIVGPFLTTYTSAAFPDLDFGPLYTILQGILGFELIGSRTFEKLKGVQHRH